RPTPDVTPGRKPMVGRHGGVEAEVVGGAVQSGDGGGIVTGAELALNEGVVTIDEPQPHTNGPVGDLDGVTGVGVGDDLVDAGGLGGVGHGELHGSLLVWGEHGDGARAGGVSRHIWRKKERRSCHAYTSARQSKTRFPLLPDRVTVKVVELREETQM